MMDILSRIECMLLERNWSEKELSRRAQISHTTINTWYRKKQTPTLYSLDKVSKAFGVTLSELLAEEEDLVELSEQDKEFFKVYYSLNPEQRKLLAQFLESRLPQLKE